MAPTLKQACFQAEPGSAICVQRFDDSLNSAIRTTYRISLRSSSLREPRYPLLEVVCCLRVCRTERIQTGPAHMLSPRHSPRVHMRTHASARASTAPCQRTHLCRCLSNSASQGCVRFNSAKRRSAARTRPARASHALKTALVDTVAVDLSVMILPQVHLRKPCYDFSFL